MKKEDIKILILFIICIILIITISLINYNNHKDLNIDRKKIYIFNEYKYNDVLNKGKNLFFKAKDLVNLNNFILEKDENDKVIYYTINKKKYWKITNIDITNNVFTKKEQEKYFNDNNIIFYENDYYIQEYQSNINNNYIGSMIEISSYDEDYVYFESTNYFCEDSEYIGNITIEPSCHFTKTKTTFKLVLEDDNLLITSYEDIKVDK